jgi:hypothetical protein
MEGPGGLAARQEEAGVAPLAAARPRRPNGAPVPPPPPPIHASAGSTMCTLWPPAQPHPKPHRVIAGVSFAARLFAAAGNELDLDLDGEGPADAEDGSEEAGPSSVVDLSLLPLSALMRYVRHYSLSVPPECNKARLVTAVEEHFCGTVVDEARVPRPPAPPPPTPPPPAPSPTPSPLSPAPCLAARGREQLPARQRPLVRRPCRRPPVRRQEANLRHTCQGAVAKG